MKPLRVLLVHNRYQQRGGEDVVFDRERALLEGAGVVVETLVFTNDEIRGPWAKLRTAWRTSYSRASARAVAARITDFRPDLVHVHNTFPLITPSVLDACRAAGVPVVKTLHNYRLFCANGLLLRQGEPCTLCSDRKPWRSVTYGCYRQSGLASVPVARLIDRHLKARTWERKVDLFFCLTDFARGLFSRVGLPVEKLYLKPNFSPDVGARIGTFASVRGEGAFYLGRLSEEKGLRTLAEAWRGKSFSLRVIGDGPLASFLREEGLPPESGLPQESAWRELAKGRCLVVPTECYEGAVPLVILEALSLGLPVVATRMGGIPGMLTHEENALLVPAKDPGALRAAVTRLLQDDALWQKLSAGGRELYRSSYSEDSGLEGLLAGYRKVLEKTGKPL